MMRSKTQARAFLRYGAQVFFVCVLFMATFFCPAASADMISIKQIINDPKRYDGQEVTIQGEVVGDIMERKNGIWVNVDDGSESIGIWVTKDIMVKTPYIGNYKTKGNIYKIEGVFHNTCALHGGETDIHATELKSIREGYLLKHPISGQKFNVAFIFFTLAFIILGIYLWKNRATQQNNGPI
jgi:hypothetical protein